MSKNKALKEIKNVIGDWDTTQEIGKDKLAKEILEHYIKRSEVEEMIDATLKKLTESFQDKEKHTVGYGLVSSLFRSMLKRYKTNTKEVT